MASNYHIVYPRGDRKKLCVIEICYGLEYELADYDVASRRSFPDRASASKYAKELAAEHGLQYEGHADDGPDYLD